MLSASIQMQSRTDPTVRTIIENVSKRCERLHLDIAELRALQETSKGLSEP